MSTTNRAARLKDTYRVLKKHYKAVAPADRTVLEHLLYACCLEHASCEAADEAFARLQQTYYDWNEVRVTTVAELADVMNVVPRPQLAGAQLRRTLQSVFECFYSFDLEELTKENIGQAVKKLERLAGVTPYVIAYVTQNGLGGHRVPVASQAVEVLRVVGVISDNEAAKRRVPGLERAIAKNQGVEFGSLLHQVSVDYAAAPFSPRVRKILLDIAADASERFPKRASRKKTAAKKTRTGKTGRKKTQAATGKSSKAAAKSKKKAAKKSRPVKATKRPKKVAKKKLPTAKKTTKKSATKRLTKKKPR